MFDFIKIELIDIIDITLVGILIYQAYKLIKGTAALNIFTGILLFYFIWLVVKALRMNLLSAILGQVIGVGVLALIILFQQEIRRFLLRLGTRYMDSSHKLRIVNLFFGTQGKKISNEDLNEITQACRRMSESKTGALIVMARGSSLEFVTESGDRLDAKIGRRLIENIFFKNAPMHDGAMVIASEKIVAARCTLPISENPHIPAYYGMRHRAAVGITEESDSVVIVVSEQTGEISFVSNGEIKKMNSITELRISIENSFKTN
ncbi:MAG: diadenylate cyclase CdaA [Bacteroidales bacterium]